MATTRYFSGQVSTACGPATAGVGPFYCPGDNHVYIDLTFYQELANRFGASGQFAQAYVLAHEYGHHMQTLLGIEAAMRRAQQRDPGNANQYSVLLELQADCFAGVWANNASRTTDAGGQPLFKSLTTQDIQEALNAAAAVGDDSIQRKSGVAVNEGAFTHGSSAQREQWTYQRLHDRRPEAVQHVRRRAQLADRALVAAAATTTRHDQLGSVILIRTARADTAAACSTARRGSGTSRNRSATSAATGASRRSARIASTAL